MAKRELVAGGWVKERHIGIEPAGDGRVGLVISQYHAGQGEWTRELSERLWAAVDRAEAKGE